MKGMHGMLWGLLVKFGRSLVRHAVDRTEIAQLIADVQHFIRGGLPVGLSFACVPSAVSDLLNEGVATFLRRADRTNLHEAASAEVTAS